MGRRKKLKYRDVVGGKNKTSNKNQKPKAPHKQKKTYSLYKPKKRKLDMEYEKPKKITKIEEQPQPSEESESEEEVDDLKQLQAVFKKNKTSADSESSEEEESSNDHNKDQEPNEETHTDDKIDRKNQEIDADEVDSEPEITEEFDPNTQQEDEGVENSADPFVKHLFYDLHDNSLSCLQSTPIKTTSQVINWPKLGKLPIQIPQFVQEESNTNKFSIEKEKKFASPGSIPNKIDHKNFKWQDLSIKEQIIPNLSKANNESNFTQLQSELFSIVNNYQDLYYTGRNFNNSEEIRFVYCLHAVNHVLKTRTKVLHHNARLTKKDDVPDEYRDQGLVRPKVLIIVPFKDSAYKIVKTIINILIAENKGNVQHKKRFLEDYTGRELVLPKKNPKPEDYELTFTGNTGDDFRIGLTITKKSLKLYANFYSSDIIIASPLGLRTVIGAEGEPDRNYDFLASLELLIFDQTEIFLMQNWDHLIHVLNHLHLQPKESHGTDFSRVRNWCLNGWAKYYRQTLIFSSLMLPEINSVFNKRCVNYAGKVKVFNNVEFGCIRQVVGQLPHVFYKFDVTSVAESIDQRFDFFVSKVLPQQKESLMKATLIYVASYFDYVRLRNYFKKEDISFVQICEYSKDNKIARARDMFFHGDAHFLLYTERYHFFNRIRVKGIRHIVFYQPPSFPHFYYEMCNLMLEANMNRKVGNTSNMTVTVIYSKYDVHQLATIVGTEKASKMIQSDRNVHMMITGSD